MFTRAEWDEFVTHLSACFSPGAIAFSTTVLVLLALWLWRCGKWEQAVRKEIADYYQYMIDEYQKAPPELKRRLDEWAATRRRNDGK